MKVTTRTHFKTLRVVRPSEVFGIEDAAADGPQAALKGRRGPADGRATRPETVAGRNSKGVLK